MKPLVALLLAFLAGCSRDRRDPLVAEVQGPLHAVVRSIDARAPRQCLQRSTWLQKLKCPFEPAPTSACTWLELGGAADLPLESDSPRWQRCIEQNTFDGQTRLRLASHATKHAQLWVEPGERRLAISIDGASFVVLLAEGRAQTVLTLNDDMLFLGDGGVDWSLAGGLIEALPSLDFEVTDEALDAALAADPKGLERLSAVMLRDDGASADGEVWLHALTLLPADSRRALEPALRRVAIDGNERAFAWFVLHPELRDADWSARIEAALREGSDVSGPLALLARDRPALAGRLACERLGLAWEGGINLNYDGTEMEDLSAIAVPAAVIARLKVKCPWVTALLDQRRCATELSCVDPTGGEAQHPLCSEAEQDAAVQALTLAPTGTLTAPVPRPPEPDEEEEEEDEASSPSGAWLQGWGPALLAAARAQGPLPVEILTHYRRRGYRQRFIDPTDAGSTQCADAEPSGPEWLCGLPLEVTQSRREGCRLDLDDGAKTASFTEEAQAP